MNKILDVYFFKKLIGQLQQDNHGDISFTYADSWLDDPDAIGISFSLPLQKRVFKRKECNAFFGGILPEEIQRKIIAKNLGISSNNDFSMLEKIGGECAGALMFMPAGGKPDLIENTYRELTDAMLISILEELPERPLLAGEQDIRLSLAGVQDKLAVYVHDEKISIPLNNSPSTHILKPDFTIFEGVIFDEEFCLRLAKNIGLSVAEAQLKKTGDINYLLIKRYDRINKKNDKNLTEIERLHQEDFCQALGIVSSNKYQNEGGPSLKQSFDLIRKISSVPAIDLDKMINAVIFNYLIGNCDAHGKNFSILYSDKIQLAPLYDLICTLYYKDLDKKMAMKLGSKYQIMEIEAADFDVLADEIGFSKPEIRRRILNLIEVMLNTLPAMEIIHHVQEGVRNLIKKRCIDFAAKLRTI